MVTPFFELCKVANAMLIQTNVLGPFQNRPMTYNHTSISPAAITGMKLCAHVKGEDNTIRDAQINSYHHTRHISNNFSIYPIVYGDVASSLIRCQRLSQLSKFTLCFRVMRAENEVVLVRSLYEQMLQVSQVFGHMIVNFIRFDACT